MDNLDVAGILRTYAEKAANVKDTRRLRKLIAELKRELDLRKVKVDNGK